MGPAPPLEVRVRRAREAAWGAPEGARGPGERRPEWQGGTPAHPVAAPGARTRGCRAVARAGARRGRGGGGGVSPPAPGGGGVGRGGVAGGARLAGRGGR